MRTALACALLGLLGTAAVDAQVVLPSLFDALSEEFEAGTLEDWGIAPGSTLDLSAAAAHSGSAGLEVAVDSSESHLVQGGSREVARADEAYLTFWFDPNGVAFNDPGTSNFIPDRSIQIAAIKGPSFKNLVAIRFREVGGGYEAFLEWRNDADSGQWDHAAGSFPLTDGWQEITIGYRMDEWVACWIGGSNVRSLTTGVSHFEPYGSVVEIGKTLSNVAINPSGDLYFDEVALELPRYTDLYVDAATGDDSFDGQTPGTAFATISRASDLAGASTIVHIEPGIYRESVVPAQGGLAGEPVVYRRSANAVDEVVIRGSEASSSLSWTQLATDTIGLPTGADPTLIWWTDLSSWGMSKPPAFLVRLGPGGAVAERLPLAREPDWEIVDGDRPSRLWWQAQGGSASAGCNPAVNPNPDCDVGSRSSLQLTDAGNDLDPPGIESGNLTTLGDLVGATLVARDTVRGSFRYRRSIVAHDVPAGRVTVDSTCTVDGGSPGLGWMSQYFVEDHPGLLDSPGEWWLDLGSGRLYLWPPSPGDPAGQDLEISLRDDGFGLADRSWVELRELALELFNRALVNSENQSTGLRSVGNRVIDCSLRYADSAILLKQVVEACCHADKRIEDFRIEDNEIREIDFLALRVTSIWDNGSSPDDWVRPGIFDVQIQNNLFQEIGARPPPGADTDAGILFRHADRITFEGNTVSDSFHDGVAFGNSVIQSAATWGFTPAEIVTGRNLVKDNVIERACRIKGDCGALRIWGLPPDNHVFRDLLLIGNTFRDTFGISQAAALRDIDVTGQIDGAGGSGVYLDNTAGVHAHRNVAYNNGQAGFRLGKTWRDGAAVFAHNVAADNVFGFLFGNLASDTHDPVDTRVVGSILINNEAYGIQLADLDGVFTNTTFDFNRYSGNGWGSNAFNPGALHVMRQGNDDFWPTLAQIQANTPFEAAGAEGDPLFLLYDPQDDDPFDLSRPDFRLRTGSPAVDAGAATLPPSLADLLALFALSEAPLGSAFDQGAFEGETPCGDLTLANQTISMTQTVSACDTVTLGPGLLIESGVELTVQAGLAIVAVGGVSLELNAALITVVGEIP